MIRYTPTLSFALDTSIEQGVRLTQLIDSVTKPGARASSGAAETGDDHVIDEGDYAAPDARVREDDADGQGQ